MKYRTKHKLYELVKSRLDEANNIGVDEVKANKEISRKILELCCPKEEIDNEKRATIDRDVWIDLVGLGGEVLGYGVGDEKLKAQTKKVDELENTVGRFRNELKLFQTMFQGYGKKKNKHSSRKN
uniref:Uncharacterized protein n=1 Tax=Tanacetum cinerariifolium TaxID=118510 RepID=A0A6L2JMJ6_TANCI|nr:hypothetical protein [Tanacetum cinerariifolium]